MDSLSKLTKGLIHFITTVLSTPGGHVSEEMVMLLTSNLPKTVVSTVVKREVE